MIVLISLCVFCTSLFIALISAGIMYILIIYFNDRSFIIKIIETERQVIDEDGRDVRYIVKGVNHNGDEMIFDNVNCNICRKFNSCIMHGLFERDHYYKIRVIGYAIPNIECYPNILCMKEVKNYADN